MYEWEKFLDKMEAELGKPATTRWLRSLSVASYDACNLYLEAKDPLQLYWFEEHVRPKLSLVNRNGRKIAVHISVKEEVGNLRTKKSRPAPPPQFPPDALLPHAQLSTFVCVDNPLLAQFLKDPNSNYNPVLLCGDAGSGKTHLLMALAHALKKRGLRCHYVKADTFTQHVVNAIRTFHMRELRQVYRQNDALLIDDVQLFARKDATQEELFHTFNALHLSGKQIILSSAVPPAAMKEIEPRLVSRFEWGLVLTLHALAKKAWDQALCTRCDWLHFPLSEEVRACLIRSFSSLSTLFRALDALILRVHLEGSPLFKRNPRLLKEEHVRAHLKDLMEKERETQITQEHILHAVAYAFGIRQEDITGRSQAQECAHPRHIAMYLLRTELNLSFKAISRQFLRDHSTVMASVSRVQKHIEQKNPHVLSKLSEIKQRIKSL